ncbi:hypothetical protein [Nocardioides turkmenicus]|uniref:hypothetical protein n=1 Tax=Nocardioides turkmenicus TaxID=2711220 RepID=UPI001F494EB3|nr:hypothetical protein [Nocardioides sp. KC13]
MTLTLRQTCTLLPQPQTRGPKPPKKEHHHEQHPHPPHRRQEGLEAHGSPRLDVTGPDLAAFCDARLPEQHDAYRAKLRNNLNEVAQKLS